MASFTAGPNGALIATSLPPQKTAAIQNVEGGVLEAASQKTLASRASQIHEFKSLGAGQKGGRRKHRGGAAANVPPSVLPTANSIPGVSHENVTKNSIDVFNKITAGAAYDKLSSAQPKLVGGRSKKRRSTKKNGRKHKRTHRRRSRRHSRVSRRSRRTI